MRFTLVVAPSPKAAPRDGGESLRRDAPASETAPPVTLPARNRARILKRLFQCGLRRTSVAPAARDEAPLPIGSPPQRRAAKRSVGGG